MHKSSFRHEGIGIARRYQNSKKVWLLNDEQKYYAISWRIAAKGYPTKGGNKDCHLCMTEKLLILSKRREPDNNLLNSRKELISKGRHSNKFMLQKFL